MRRYPEYKASGAEWIGEIPAHWKLINTKYLFRLVTEPAPKHNDYELLSIYTDVGVKPRKELEERGNRATTTDGYWLVKKGDFIVNKLLAWMGAIGLSDYEGVTSPAYDILRKIRPLNERFYEYLLRCGLYFIEFKKWSRGIMEVRLRLYFDQFGQIPLVFPPVDEQDKIVAFLDHKTGQIDELIRIKERRIELLQEQRTALINQAVTKGLDPNVEMKPSGVEWIGEIPSYWQTATIKYLTENLDGKRIPLSGEVRAGQKQIYPYYGANGVIDYVEDYIFEGKYILIGEDGAPFFDKKREVSLLVSGKFWVNNHCHILKNIGASDARFIVYCLNSVDYSEYLTGSTRDKLTQADLNRIKIPIPSYLEQSQIANVLDCKTKQIDDLISTEHEKIELLKEYRQSLISEVVTGKIDVRNEV